jgi:hypothetical protein
MALVVSARSVFCAISFHSEIAAALFAWFVSLAVAVEGARLQVKSAAAPPYRWQAICGPLLAPVRPYFLVVSTCLSPSNSGRRCSPHIDD